MDKLVVVVCVGIILTTGGLALVAVEINQLRHTLNKLRDEKNNGSIGHGN